MTRLFYFALIAATFALTGCSTVTDLVVTNIPNNHQGKAKIVVNLKKQTAYLYKGKTLVAESRISAGREGHDTPTGHFSVRRKDRDHRSSLYGDYVDRFGRVVVANVDTRKTPRPPRTHLRGAPMPYYLEFRSGGYGLHAGYLPGYPASHGCVRMPFWKARQFFNEARIGTPVILKDG